MEEENNNQPIQTQNDMQAHDAQGGGFQDEPPKKQNNPSDNHASMRKKVLIILSIGLALIAAAGIAFLLLQDNKEEDVQLQPIANTEVVTTLGASIASVEGTVQFSSDSESWKDAEGGESLAHLDYIRTLDDSRAIVLFDDGSIVRLDANTVIYLSSLQKDASEITLQTGQVYNRVVESENSTYTVVTANERFTALGTAFSTSTDDSKDELAVYESKVEVESQDVVVSEGNKYDTESKESSALDIDALEDDEFTQWNKEKDSEIDKFKDKLGVLADKKEKQNESKPTPQSTQPAGITLSAATTDKGVKLNWSVSGLSLKQGFKLVRDKTDSTPSYGQHQAQYVGDTTTRSAIWYDDSGGTYYYRICIYEDGTCGTYSNSVQVKSPFVKKETVKSGTVNLEINGSKISWNLEGGNAPHGFKIVMSKSQNPTYPEHSIKYVGAGTSSVTLPEKSAGTYFVRVCKYTNGTQEAGCVDYSNQVEYVIE